MRPRAGDRALLQQELVCGVLLPRMRREAEEKPQLLRTPLPCLRGRKMENTIMIACSIAPIIGLAVFTWMESRFVPAFLVLPMRAVCAGFVLLAIWIISLLLHVR